MTKLILLGGFLGSGKTTFMVKAASLLEQQGMKVSVISNDQGDTLVDTMYSRWEGLDSHEVSGGCFCCRFPDFLDTLKAVIAETGPDVIIAEAVGSCTDLAATVINPLVSFHQDTVEVKAYLSLVDGLRMQKEYLEMDLINPSLPGEVLISHQIRESEVLVLSKSDLLDEAQCGKSLDYLKQLNSRAINFVCSSRTGEGLEALLEASLKGFPLDFTDRVPIDYQVYAEAEAAYGWYNGSWTIESTGTVDPMDVSFPLMESFRNPELGEVAHAKVLLVTPLGGMKVSFVMGHIQADDINVPEGEVKEIRIVLNIRSACSPQVIEKHVESVQAAQKEEGFTIRDYTWNSLVPSPPEPYYS
ncbi:MAG: GTP-binding protein [Spirochaetales bacterium]|nr:GTP-binding protein [Spirochaetales bacterium]